MRLGQTESQVRRYRFAWFPVPLNKGGWVFWEHYLECRNRCYPDVHSFYYTRWADDRDG